MRFIKDHWLMLGIIIIGLLFIIVPVLTRSIDNELTIDGMYNFIGSFFGIIGAVMLAFSETKQQNKALRDEIDLNARKERQIQAEFLYKELLFQKIEKTYGLLNTAIYKNEEIMSFIKDIGQILESEKIRARLIENRNETEKYIHEIELMSIYFPDDLEKVKLIVSTFNYSNKYLSTMEHELLIGDSKGFRKELDHYKVVVKRLVQVMDELSIDMLGSMNAEINKLNDIGNTV
ncbi:hypothetical protein BMT55_04315 [Listeria newyorkensis]|uniref:5-bromo-4-chloroindolyl phosphate hydrolysis protein n=1 Tax=Listeria newyorkensis TaxID=1497681 RepID=A0ABX4XWA6_9LIST|nr:MULTISPECIES: hypothetical protein [Listeria]KGL41169.1 hypothetical protein EP56_11230 [Listeriaceae bacterium FSL A5-0209]KGL41885.1 hypothetical protein EP58_10085 [Listeria newyorkensis]KMT62177.1 hypothetical protein X559_1474 [Listeria newyorkensis]PNP93995.1 hypothetical protein BMT55_04315 [Listeria newyorkensis]RQW67483.1 hypothetical protein DUK53_06955 [Listeria sp. SHR_NRA_18]